MLPAEEIVFAKVLRLACAWSVERAARGLVWLKGHGCGRWSLRCDGEIRGQGLIGCDAFAGTATGATGGGD